MAERRVNRERPVELVDRDYKQVDRNLSELQDIGVIEFEGGGSGRAKNRSWPTTGSKSTFRSLG
jgi:predicted transcriptional regulator